MWVLKFQKWKIKLLHATTLKLLKSNAFNADFNNLIHKASLNIQIFTTIKFLFRIIHSGLKSAVVKKIQEPANLKNNFKITENRSKNLLLPLDKATKPRGAAD